MPQFFIYYAESNLVCVVIFGIMLARDLLSADRQEKQIKYDRTLVAFMLYFVCDAVWAAVESGVLPKTLLSVTAINFVNYILMAAITYLWLEFVMAVEQVPHRERTVNKFAVIFPFLIVTIAMIIVYFVSRKTLIDDDLNTTMAYNVFRIAVPDIYIAAVLVYALRKMKDEVNPIEKRRHLYIGLFPLLVVAGGLVEALVFRSGTPVFCFASTVLMLIFYIQSIEKQISMDPLTRLNNRGQLVRYISQETNIHREDRKSFVIMIDVNDFKAINDTCGHSEGDRALVIVAESLKKVTKSHSMPSFLGRYGGDEFIIIVHPAGEGELDPFVEEIRRQIDAACRGGETPYVLSVGVGFDEYLGEQDTFQKCIQRADHKLYLDKEYCKLHGDTTVLR